MLTLKDGRTELWQWDTGREVAVSEDCSQVHFSNKIQGRSIDVDVVDGVAKIPDVLLQTDGLLNVWAFVGTAENGYTKVSRIFVINKRNRPADYVFTPTEQTSIKDLDERLKALEEAQDPEAVENAVKEYLEKNPIEENDPTVPQWAKEEKKPTYTADEVGAIDKNGLQGAVDMALEQAKASGEFDGPKGDKGDPGTDATVTTESIKTALGYTPADEQKVEQLSEEIANLKETGTGTGGDYTLPVATSEILGGVKPVLKTDTMTQEVGVDSEGKLYTEPTTSSGGSGDGTIADGSVTTEKIADKAVTPEKTTFFDIVKKGTSVLKTLPDGSKTMLVDATLFNAGGRYGQNVFHVNLKAGKKYMIVQNETGSSKYFGLVTFNGSKPSADYTTSMIWLPLTDSDGNLTGEYSDAVITGVDTSQPNSTSQWWTGEYDEFGLKTYETFTYDDNGTTLKVVYYAFTIDKDFEGLISFSKNGAINTDYVEILDFEDIETAYNPLFDGFPITSDSTEKSEEYLKESVLETPVKNIMKNNVSIISPLNGLKWCALGDSLTDWGGGNCDVGNDADFGFITQIMRKTGIIGTNKGYAGGHWTSDATETDGYTESSAVKNVNDIINGNVDYDIVTIAYGTNSDTNGDGTAEDMADQYASMCSAIKWCIEKLIAWKPSLQIGIILPPQRADMGTNGNISMRTRGDLIKSVAELYGVPCCDMWRESGINTMTYKTTNSDGEEVDAYYYLADGLHLGGETRDYNGFKKYGAKLKSFLESIAPIY